MTMNTGNLKTSKLSNIFGHIAGAILCVFGITLIILVAYKTLVWVWSW
jgi:hypothetical protein